ncbi:class I adenylate-forming enzyme family protein [Mycobacterium pseudokansasii]|uniref:class I adenylate-forming enzyme family protein n=1 Tax=Mycobacterium pseudokansasii TaxID=2341080 RepID=UPI0007B53346|nr:class I adenylate-forming enzyme family protein [Mycobacterium pseudokansasii]KZS62744.1 acyl-CoA synthetase [Mycobacterium kansasii]VAZ95859.1 2-succinylbenzoate--CoA ligase [Mycobacterium pseudokansasii]VAZ97223.1 2-succinylbenzoate--CoA ligase [Mycobacterium pseudokansasii]
MNIGTIIDAPAAGTADRAALIIGERYINYGDLGAAVRQCAAGLAVHGVGPGERVAVVDGGSLLSIATVLGAARIGAAAALMNPALTPAELRVLLENAGCSPVAVAGAAYADRVRDAGALTVVTDLVDEHRAVAALPTHDVDDREALILFTSGTTGLPKAVGITGRQLTTRIQRMSPPFRADATPSVRMMCVPFFHVGGALGMLGSLYSGNTSVVQTRFDAGEWLRLVSQHRVTATFLVPTMLQRILDHPDFACTDLTSLVAIAYGAAAAPIALVRRAMAALPHVAFANVFGQTETLGAYTTLLPEDHHDPARAGSVGRPLPGVEVRVVDPATGADVAPATVGELWVKTAQSVTDGWLRTGDLGRVDADGYLYPTGRVKDTINRGGEKFGPIEVEEALRSHPAVTDVAVAGIADAEMGQRVGAAVVVRSPVTLDELRSHCRDLIAYFKLPEKLAIVEAIPYSATGKVNRRQLAALISGED